MLSYRSSSEDKFSPVLSCRLTFSINQQHNWQYKDLFFSTPKTYKIKLIDDTLGLTLFQGWKEAWGSSEPIDTPSFDCLISATDFLNELDQIKYPNTSATAPGVAINLDTILFDNILNETGLGLEINHNIDNFETNFATSSSQNIITQLYIMLDALQDNDGEFISCGEIMKDILLSQGARIFQAADIDNGVDASWIIQQVNLVGSQTWYNWDGASNSSSVIDYTFNFPIDVKPMAGGNYSLIPAKNDITLRIDDLFIENLIEGDYRRGTRISNFTDDDFATATTLHNWGTVNRCKLISSWTTKTFSGDEGQVTTDIGTALRWDGVTERFYGGVIPDQTVTLTDNGAGGIRITYPGAHGYPSGYDPLTDTEYVVLDGFGYCDGIHLLGTYISSTVLDLSFPFDSNQGNVGYANYYAQEPGTWKVLENHILDTTAFSTSVKETAGAKFLNVSITFKVHGPGPYFFDSLTVPLVIIAYESGTNYKCLNNVGEWVDDSSGSVFFAPLVYMKSVAEPGEWETVERSFDLSSSNNFYTSGTPELSIAIMEPFLHFSLLSVGAQIYIDQIKVWVTPQTEDDSETASAGGSDYSQQVNTSLRFFDAPEEGWSEKIYQNGYRYSNSGVMTHTDNWGTKAGSKTQRLQDFLADIYAGLYDVESITARMTVDGMITPQRNIVDFFNFERIYLITSLSTNLETDVTNVSAIEVDPQGELELVQDIESGVATTLQEAYMLSRDFAYFVGASDVVIKWDGSSVAADSTGSSGIDYNAIFIFDIYNIWAGGESGTLYFNDGTSWNVESPNTSNIIYDVFFLTPQLGWLCTSAAEIEKTIDNNNWTAQTSNLTGALNLIKFKNTLVGITVGGTSTETAVRITSDGGTTWSAPATFDAVTGRLFDLWNFDNSSIWISSGSKGAGFASGVIIYISFNDGSDWSILYQDAEAVGSFAGFFDKKSYDKIYLVGNDYWTFEKRTSLVER
ncbi:MAG TPA: hypothetical protein VGA94_06650, partial [Thermodesulfobacteriota bacterium]